MSHDKCSTQMNAVDQLANAVACDALIWICWQNFCRIFRRVSVDFVFAAPNVVGPYVFSAISGPNRKCCTVYN